MKHKYLLNLQIIKEGIAALLIAVMVLSLFLLPGCASINGKKEVLQVSAEKVNKIIGKDKNYILLDVRTLEEYDTGHLKDALLIPVDELEERIDEVPEGKPVIVYCRSGRRSAKAAEILLQNGFLPVYDMQGGIEKWKEEGYFVYGDKVTYYNIDIDAVFEIVNDKNSGYQVVDVRSSEEYSKAHIKGAVSVPVSEIKNNLSMISKELPVIVYCSSSTCGSSSQAAEILYGLGFKQVFAMNAGIEEWLEKDYPVESGIN